MCKRKTLCYDHDAISTNRLSCSSNHCNLCSNSWMTSMVCTFVLSCRASHLTWGLPLLASKSSGALHWEQLSSNWHNHKRHSLKMKYLCWLINWVHITSQWLHTLTVHVTGTVRIARSVRFERRRLRRRPDERPYCESRANLKTHTKINNRQPQMLANSTEHIWHHPRGRRTRYVTKNANAGRARLALLIRGQNALFDSSSRYVSRYTQPSLHVAIL